MCLLISIEFLAVRIGAPAYEVKDTSDKYHGIYTSCFLDAYSNPDDSMIEEINDFSVVTNKKLEDYLLSEVPRRAQISNVQEYPNSVVTSRNYIGRVQRDMLRVLRVLDVVRVVGVMGVVGVVGVVVGVVGATLDQNQKSSYGLPSGIFPNSS